MHCQASYKTFTKGLLYDTKSVLHLL